MALQRFSLACAALAAAALLAACNSILGFQEGKPYPPDAGLDASVAMDGSDADGPVAAEGGCPSDPTAWTLVDYKGLPGFRGKGRFSDEQLQEMVDSAAKLGWQMGLHAIGDAAIVQTDDNTLSTMIEGAKIRELPIPANRNLFRLALLAPGMSRGPASSVTTSGFGPGFGIASMGQKVHNNAIMLDGAPLKTSMHGAVRMRPSVEAIEEFRVESGWYSAEYGTQSGAQIIATIRPGTNQFHKALLFSILHSTSK